MSKLNIIEAMKMPIGTSFKVLHKIQGENCQTMIIADSHGEKVFKWSEDDMAMIREYTIDATFIPIQQPVSFMEAIESYSKGKIIKSTEEIDGQIFTHIYVPDGIADCIEDDSRCAMTSREILNGKWYIEESEEQN